MRRGYHAIILLGLIFFQCKDNPTQPKDNDISPITILALKVAFYEPSTEVLTTDSIPLNFKCRFPFIEGNLYGGTSFDDLITAMTDENGEITISLTESIFTESTKPTIKNTDLLEYGLQISPEDTKFGRLGTFGETIPNQNVIGYGLVDGDTKEAFFIAYFDRKCTITGTTIVNTLSYTTNISIPTDGFYCIKFSKLDAKTFIIETSNPPVNGYFALYKSLPMLKNTPYYSTLLLLSRHPEPLVTR